MTNDVIGTVRAFFYVMIVLSILTMIVMLDQRPRGWTEQNVTVTPSVVLTAID